MRFREEMQAMMAGYIAAYEAHDATGCAAIYADDVTIYSSYGPPIHGRAAAAEAHEFWFTPGERNKRIDVIDCAAFGDHAFCLIAYSAEVTEEDGTVRPETGTNLCALTRTGGDWKIRHSSMTAGFPD